jgi:enoyl-CoA hydratase
MYLGLTGARLTAGDMLELGLATHCVAGKALDPLTARLTTELGATDTAATIDAILAAHAAAPPKMTTPAQRATIERCFGLDRVEALLPALDKDGSAFATAATAALRAASPTSLKLTFAQLRRGLSLDFDDCMRMEYNLTQSVMAGHDFYEGIRAQLIDKDRNPVWTPATLDAVDDAAITAMFAAPPGGELDFPH